METLTSDNPGDCQAVAADSTTTTTTTPALVANSVQHPATRSITNSEDVSSTTNAATPTSSSAPKQGTPTSPPTTHGGGNKIKTQQQQQQQQQQQNNATTIKFHQFRAPQQFVKQRKATSMLAKKNKTWNKRQNKCLHKQQQQQCVGVLPAGIAAVGMLGLSAAAVGGGTLPATKADLENIQNCKNQLGVGGGGGGAHHHPYYHHHSGGHHGGGRGGGGSTANNGIAPCLCALEKLGYGHGHIKQQQLFKKMLAHRGHHHHVLCAGAAHNSSGGGGAAGINSACCLANGCTIPNGKDTANSNSHNNSSHSNITHYCCGRSKFFLPDKRPRKEVIVPPTKFLLGGTISDPLNLNSLQNESASNASSNNNTPATTPRQSPITTPPKVEVIIPPNIYDPLHLLDPVDSMEYEKQLTSPMKRKSKAPTKKHRHRKNRKPKRRRYESYNSTTMEDDALSLAGSGIILGSSSLANSTLSTDLMTSNTTASLSSISLTLSTTENTSGTCGVNSVGASKEEHEEHHKSPVPLMGADLLLSSTATGEQLEKNIILSPSASNQQHVAGIIVGEPVAAAAAAGAVAEVQHVRRTSERERVSKDLRLDLSMCGVIGGSGGGVGGSGSGSGGAGNHSNNSAASSTCGSIGTLGSGGGGGLGAGLCGGRKRKISENSNSQKNKKFHRVDSMDKIVSPVVPQPGAWKRPPRLVPTGARKSSRRSTSVSETELLSPADEAAKALNDTDSNRGDTPDISKMESLSEAALGSPLSSASATTSLTTGEQDTASELLIGDTAIPAMNLTSKDETSSVTSATSIATIAVPPPNTIAQLSKMPKFRPDGAKYQYGNYDRYAGFRHLNEFMDVRLQVFQRHLELFKNKDILDIGCNVGHMTITVARSLAPKSILGIDIDKELIARARRNLSMYVRLPAEAKLKTEIKTEIKQESSSNANKLKKTRRQKKKKQQQQQQQPTAAVSHSAHHHHHHHMLLHHQHHQHLSNKLHLDAAEFFPVSFPISYGGMPDTSTVVATPSTSSGTPGNNTTAGATGVGSSGSCATKPKNDFPKNVYFRHQNYVLKDEGLLNNDSQQYDLILCLSVTKWIHLNFGDNGLKLAFKRMFNQLRPGGKLILEAQNWASYKKKKNLTEQIYNNYCNIEFFPNKIHEYLLSSEVGFSHSYTLGAPRHLNKGFCRPIQLYAKGDYTPNHVRWSDAYYPQTPYEAYRGIYATMPPRSHPLISSSRSQNYDTPHGGGGMAHGPGSGSYSLRQTPMHQPTSQYYNPLETDSYLPSYDMEYLNHLYVFASPLYQTVWSPPASLRNSSTHTPLFGSVREAELDGDVISGGSAGGGSYHRHVYPPNDDTSSPNANAGGAFSSIRDPDTDDSNQLPASNVQHVYATNCESSSSPQVLHPHELSEPEGLMLADEQGDSNDV